MMFAIIAIAVLVSLMLWLLDALYGPRMGPYTNATRIWLKIVAFTALPLIIITMLYVIVVAEVLS